MSQDRGVLIVMAGLPGVGKTTIAAALAAKYEALLLSVDSIESVLCRAEQSQGSLSGLAAYFIAEEIASENLKLGRSVVVDAVNDVKIVRDIWGALARRRQTKLLFVEVVCSDLTAYQERLATRDLQLSGKSEVTFADVVERFCESEPWRDEPRLMVDNLPGIPLMNLVQRICHEC
ncbi:MAG: AAA family ATPase [Propionibacteriaceae bacterium]